MVQAQELANKDAAYKEIQIKLEAMEQHCEVQQQLLQHACNLEYGAGYMNMEDETSPNNTNTTTNAIAGYVSIIINFLYFWYSINTLIILNGMYQQQMAG